MLNLPGDTSAGLHGEFWISMGYPPSYKIINREYRYTLFNNPVINFNKSKLQQDIIC